jgi:hypothetical protein
MEVFSSKRIGSMELEPYEAGWDDYPGCYPNIEPLTEKLKQARDPATRWKWRASTDKAGGMIFPEFSIILDIDKRCFLYLDSVLVSASEEYLPP